MYAPALSVQKNCSTVESLLFLRR